MNADALRCGSCRQPMQRLALAGHYGQRVEIDLCAPCHQIWFDAIESARLSGPGLLELLATLAVAQREPHHAPAADVECPRCRAALKPVHNRTRWGRTVQLECPRRHGALQSFAQLLAEKGLVRPMTSADRAGLAEAGGVFACLNCGAALDGSGPCSHCATEPALFDVARLAQALDPEGATRAHDVHRTSARRAALSCFACGAPAAPVARICAHCGATQAVAGLREALAALAPLRQALDEHQRRPAPHVVAGRLDRLRADLPRRREWVREMEASTRDGERLDAGVPEWASTGEPIESVDLLDALWRVARWLDATRD